MSTKSSATCGKNLSLLYVTTFHDARTHLLHERVLHPVLQLLQFVVELCGNRASLRTVALQITHSDVTHRMKVLLMTRWQSVVLNMLWIARAAITC